MASQQRLVVCLDGTWNQQDSSTNVLHHFNLVLEGPVPGEQVVQKKYYHPGVGTDVFDRVTGGGLGFGLEKNVRDAYNWLVQNYHDGTDELPADEIYIFGFSRGAYTARSLVGFIAQCGLLRRAAPLTVTELWADYCILGRQKEQRKSMWDNLFRRIPSRIRPITELAHDPWLRRATAPIHPPVNMREELLVQWSRRVRITYLGVYDTVGAIGWDALAIPGLTSRLALHNNMNPTTIIQHCCHALAMDEHRSSFNHTPLRAFIGNDYSEQERMRGAGDDQQIGEAADPAAQHWQRTMAMWNRKIEQRWFVGAHSNIGGGYEDNRLTETPLCWILDGARTAGLKSESVQFDPEVAPCEEQPRDSFAEFAAPVWTKILRAKRNYRLIDPEAQLQASIKRKDGSRPQAGFALQNIHETVDESVYRYWAAAGIPMPPNLQAYAERQKSRGKAVNTAGIPPKHEWLGKKLGENIAMIAWAALAATGLALIYGLVGKHPSDSVALWVACAVAFFFPLVDWRESAVGFRQAMGRGGPRTSAFLDSIYWTRAFGFVLFLFGVVYSLGALLGLGWRHYPGSITEATRAFLPVPVFAAAAVVLANQLRSTSAWISLILAPPLTVLAGGFVIAVGRFAHGLFPSVSWPTTEIGPVSTPGVLLLLQLSFIYFWRARVWAAEPMGRANLDSIVELQKCVSWKKVMEVLNSWQSMLQCRWGDPKQTGAAAANRLHCAVRESLWRDIMGFIPVYSGVFLFGLWFAATYSPNVFDFLNWPGEGLALWWMIPLVTAATDYIEDACQLRYVAAHERGKAPSVLLTPFSFLMSTIKGLGVLFAFPATVFSILAGTWGIRGEADDWRAKIAILISTVFVLIALIYVIGLAVHAFTRGKQQPVTNETDLAKGASA